MKVRQPQGAFLSANFYYGALPEPDALARLVHGLLKLGAIFTGEGNAHLGAGIRDLPFESYTDLLPESVSVRTIEEFSRLFANPDVRLVKLLLQYALSKNPALAEVVRFQRISEWAILKDRHPICIETEDWLFDGPVRQTHPGRARSLGRRIYQRFTDLVEATRPVYASITGGALDGVHR